jgi:hypothetical protein
MIDFGCAALLWYLIHLVGAGRAVGIIVGIFILTAGWRFAARPWYFNTESWSTGVYQKLTELASIPGASA